jgi:hypothetical protein
MIDATLRSALHALSPILDRIVVVGGAAHQIHSKLAGSSEIPLTTEDVDIVIGERGKLPDLSGALAAADFEAVPRGVTTPPSVIYRAQDGSYLQFVCRRMGAQGGRSGDKPSVEESYGLVAESLPNVQILAFECWDFEVPDGATSVKAQVAHPACFILQKGLISEERGLEERAKDLLYVHDTLRLFDPVDLRDTAQRAYASLSKAQLKKHKHWRSTTLALNASLPYSAANIANNSARGGRLTGEDVQALCSHGLELLLD